ncbi:hypothetical protein JCM11251_003534 [Rhodosporidiobolus azoricus]
MPSSTALSPVGTRVGSSYSTTRCLQAASGAYDPAPPYPAQPAVLHVEPPLEEPHPPSLNVDPFSIPSLISSSTIVYRLVRWSDPDFPRTNVDRSPDPPPWSLWMESYYQMYHPETWPPLREDHEMDKKYYFDLRDWRMWRKANGADERELQRLWSMLEVVVRRIIERFQRLYGLDFIRNRFLRYYRKSLPGKVDAEILMLTLDMEEYPPCRVAQHSVWPLPLPPPLRHPRLAPLVEVAHLARDPSACLAPYIVPDVAAPHHLLSITPARHFGLDEDRN